jgi:hypothetical protein
VARTLISAVALIPLSLAIWYFVHTNNVVLAILATALAAYPALNVFAALLAVTILASATPQERAAIPPFDRTAMQPLIRKGQKRAVLIGAAILLEIIFMFAFGPDWWWPPVVAGLIVFAVLNKLFDF